MDTSGIPLGERALRAILDHVVAVGDEAETHYLEAKSGIDLARAEGVAKVAKFLLGSANRLPRDAARHFQGYAVLVLGAGKEREDGIVRGTEPHELEDRLRPYLGTQFPAFELGRITVSPDREVLFLIAQPPRDGQTIFPCHRNYQGEHSQDSLQDGAVYVRGSSNTRHAKAGEILALVERARAAGKSPVSLDVEILGEISRVDRVDEVLEKLYDFQEREFLKPGEVPEQAFPALSVLGQSQQLGPRQRTDRLNEWKNKREAHIAAGSAYFLGVTLPGASIRVVSLDRFVAKPQLIVTFHACEAFGFRDADDARYEKVVEPVIRQTDPFGIGLDFSDIRIVPRNYPVRWSNHDGNAEVILTPESFRPNVPWVSDCDGYVLVIRDPQATAVNVTWVLTEEGNDTATTGELEITPGALMDAADLIRASFFSAT
jgi:hypothetical protein